MLKDDKEYITSIEWTPYHQVSKVIKDNSVKTDPCTGNPLVLQDLEFWYTASGQRLCKIVKPHKSAGGVSDPDQWVYTWYSYDGGGNVMAIYEETNAHVSGSTYEAKYKLAEHDVYGGGRAGVRYGQTNDKVTYTFTSTISGGAFTSMSWVTYASPAGDNDYYRLLGQKQYELVNHLGNVLVTVSDKRIPIYTSGPATQVAYYTPDVLSYSDYYAFGSVMPGRNGADQSYRYGFGGDECDAEMKGAGNSYNTDFRMYDPRVGRWLSVDPVTNPSESPYVAFANNPIYYSDPSGLSVKPLPSKVKSAHVEDYNFSKPTQEEVHQKLAEATNTFNNRLASAVAQMSSGLNTGGAFSDLPALIYSLAKMDEAIDPSYTAPNVNTFYAAMGEGVANSLYSNHNPFDVIPAGKRILPSEYSPTDDFLQLAFVTGQLGADIVLAYIASEVGVGAGSAALATVEGPPVAVGCGVVALAAGYTAASATVRGAQSLVIIAQVSAKIIHKFDFAKESSNANESNSAGGKHGTDDLDVEDVAYDIANGHGYQKHNHEPGMRFRNPAEVREFVERVLNNEKSLYRPMDNGRRAWFDLRTRRMILYNPTDPDKGTIYYLGDVNKFWKFSK